MNEDLEYLKAIGELGENEFSENVLVKLFTRMGYDRVDFNGGILEKGRDIILHKVIPLEDEPHVTIIQVKKIKNKQKIEDSSTITKLTHQIYEAIDAGAISTNGKPLKPRSLILAFPVQANERFITQLTPLMTISEAKNIKTLIYDGPKVIRDIKRYAPELLDTLVNRNTKIFDINDAFNSNEEISSAVNLYSAKNIEDIYMSLDFFVGSKNSYHLLSSEITFEKSSITCDPEEWARHCRTYNIFLNKFNLKIFKKEPSEINKDREQLLKKYNSSENKENIKNLNSMGMEIESKQKLISELQSQLKKKISQTKKEKSEYKDELTRIITLL
ncbi:MAG: restriction endonuclease [Gammaproteobacteria bacterium]|nr:restriction endonuclease [Gammaproteobacteria bacterium]MBU1553607.1 restriction endonuclease [Gammaproteobacteria bacterium]MBU2070634.1 restriction endonuclease [Gammaproteobacteria bacterium]MBU2181848.1 restriction endonuclease [Gammaproteobacteria bacterium]MBU2205518.1 restriction endonuclease [Gammaproteobacteria bacterium]